MTARCDADPLDTATDVCDHCGGEFCDEHLVYPRGATRPPLCRRCALSAGGVRSGGAPARRRSRAEITRRRAQLTADRRDGSGPLTDDRGPRGLDGPDPVARRPIEGAAPGPARRRPFGRRRAERRPDDRGSGDRPTDEAAPRIPEVTPAPASATSLLTELRDGGVLGGRSGEPGGPGKPDPWPAGPEEEARSLRTPGWVPAAAPRPLTPRPAASAG